MHVCTRSGQFALSPQRKTEGAGRRDRELYDQFLLKWVRGERVELGKKVNPEHGSVPNEEIKFSICQPKNSFSFLYFSEAVVPLAQTQRIILRDTPVSMGIR